MIHSTCSKGHSVPIGKIENSYKHHAIADASFILSVFINHIYTPPFPQITHWLIPCHLSNNPVEALKS